jgi:flagellar hook-associated protein 1 FlgK
MAGLFDSLSAVSSALDAQSMGLGVTGQNLANVNTPGYSRRTLLLAQAPPTGPNGTGGGVVVQGVQALRDEYIQARLDAETETGSYDGARATQLASVSAALGTPGASLDASLTSYFNAFTALAQDPTSTVNRDAVVQQGQALAQAFNGMSGRLSAAGQAADTAARADVDQINTLIGEVAKLNGQISGANGSNVEALKDQRAVDITQLSSLIGAKAIPSSDGSIGLTVGAGHAIVVGDTGYPISVGSTPAGQATFTLQDVDITSQLTAGDVGGQLDVRSTLVPGYLSQLDQLAYSVATQVNTIHKAGFGQSGSTNQNFFTPLASATGAAAALAVDPTLAANSSLVAASSTGTAGDNQTAQAIANLQSTGFVGAGSATPANAWGQLVYNVGADTASAQSAQSSQQQVITQLTQLRDSVSKVSTDDEAAAMMKYQQAYQANARYFTAIVETLDVLMTMVTAVP